MNSELLTARRRHRLDLLIKTHFGGNTSEFARAVGRPPQQINDMLHGRKAFGEKIARAIEAKLGGAPFWVPDLWLDLTDGQVKITRTGEWALGVGDGVSGRAFGHGNVTPGPDIRATRVPVVSWDRVGSVCDGAQAFQPEDVEDWITPSLPHGPRAFALHVRGDSMLGPPGEHSFADGDVIVVDPDVPAAHRKLVIARLAPGGDVMFRRLLIDGRRRYLEALNPSWPQRVIELPEEGSVCGVVFGRWTPL